MDPRMIQPEEEEVQEDNTGLLGDEWEKNPFEAIMNQQQTQQQEQQPMDPAAQMQALKDQQDPKKNQLLPGANPGGSKYLLGAIQQIQGFIAESTERDEIAIGRSMIQLLTRLVAKDQARMTDKIATDNQPEQPTPGGMPGGMPEGAPEEAPQEQPQPGMTG